MLSAVKGPGSPGDAADRFHVNGTGGAAIAVMLMAAAMMVPRAALKVRLLIVVAVIALTSPVNTNVASLAGTARGQNRHR